MSDFNRDNRWQRRLRDEILVPGFYGEYATEGRYVLLDKGRLTSHFQRRLAVDTINGSRGKVVSIADIQAAGIKVWSRFIEKPRLAA